MQTKVKIINFGRLYAKLRGQQILCKNFMKNLKSQPSSILTSRYKFENHFNKLFEHLNIEINTKMLYFGRFYANL